MSGKPFEIECTYNAPAHAVWEALTDKDKMKQWYFDLPEFKPEVGFEFRFYGGDEENQYLHICKITEVNPFKKLAHTWQYEGQDAITYVTFELFAEGDKTRIKLTHEGLERIAKYGSSFAPENFAAGWTDIIGNHLKNFLESK